MNSLHIVLLVAILLALAVTDGTNGTRQAIPERVGNVILDPAIEEEVLKMKQPLVGIFETELEVNEIADGIELRFSLSNVSGEAQRISHGSGQQYDLLIYNDAEELVYQWSRNKAFTQALIVKDMQRDGILEFLEIWDRKDLEEKAVPEGSYRALVVMMVGLENGRQLSPEQLRAETEFIVSYTEDGHEE